MKPTQKIAVVLAGLCLLSGIGLLLYSPVQTAAQARENRRVIAGFEEYIHLETVPPTEVDLAGEPEDPPRRFSALWDACAAYNLEIFENGQDALDAETMTQAPLSPEAYGYASEFFGYLSIPAVGLEVPISLGASAEHLDKGGAVLGQTSLPIGGENSHCVIAGHRSWNGVVCFRPIGELSPGDMIFLTNPWETLSYTVIERKTIAPSQIEEVQIQPGRDLLTLFTCASPNSQRVLVRCERVQEEVS